MVLVSAHRMAGTSITTDKKSISLSVKNAVIKFDTFYAVRIIRGGNPPKTVARDTIILVIHDLIHSPPIRKAATSYSFEMIPYNPFDTVTPSKSAAKDTIIWTGKPYRP
jgi:hypothetical protein